MSLRIQMSGKSSRTAHVGERRRLTHDRLDQLVDSARHGAVPQTEPSAGHLAARAPAKPVMCRERIRSRHAGAVPDLRSVRRPADRTSVIGST